MILWPLGCDLCTSAEQSLVSLSVDKQTKHSWLSCDVVKSRFQITVYSLVLRPHPVTKRRNWSKKFNSIHRLSPGGRRGLGTWLITVNFSITLRVRTYHVILDGLPQLKTQTRWVLWGAVVASFPGLARLSLAVRNLRWGRILREFRTASDESAGEASAVEGE